MPAYLLYFSYIHFATAGYGIIYLFVARKIICIHYLWWRQKKQDIQFNNIWVT